MNAADQPSQAAIDANRSELEEMIGQSVQRLFSDHVNAALLDRAEAGEWPSALWSLVESSGMPKALCSAHHGGSDARWPDVYPVLAGVGRWSVPLPLAETMIASWLLSKAGVEVPEGPILVAPANATLVVHRQAGQPVLDGVLRSLPWAGAAKWLLVTLRGSGPEPSRLALVALPADAPDVRCAANMAGEPRGDVHLVHASVAALFASPLGSLVDPLLCLGALARSAMLVGALDVALELSVKYANERVQFGKPLARNQVIQQSLAAVAGDVVAAKVATKIAFASLDPGLGASTTAFDVAVAKVRSGQAAVRMAAVAHQLHGAMGFTREHTLHRTTRRLWAWRQEFGGDASWAAALGRMVIAQGGARFWPSLCDRGLDGPHQASV